ncbi:Oidioi.mRNA.OKI2018_I69.XSR.g13257.t1.cds [Oikopleura dioica]|uniref:Oidioi.mRNA.OKI2018_I69.XSR.g13257.t1.cds n=1 Tax=Oikopleura dioica TaxID=34765 RepID=A0ABN7S846_OIKDI|nr:Oidioi.mRNA.OKI2018_I69.XSR.g13257.t1.cds [Oikopleura dioica]
MLTRVCLFRSLSRTMALSAAELEARSVEADKIIQTLTEKIAAIKAMGTLPANIQETILKQENSQLRKQVEALKTELTTLELRNGKTQVALPKPPKKGAAKKEAPKKAEQQEKPKNENQKKDKPKKEKKEKKPQPAKAAEPEKPVDVSRLLMKVGKIIDCKKHPDADALYLEQIECGEDKPRTVISGLVKHVPLEEMQNRMVVLLCNLKPAKMRGIVSEAMVMCASTPEKVEILAPPAGAVPGDLVKVPGFEGEPDELIKPTSKKAVSVFEQVAPGLKTNDKCQATFNDVAWEVAGKGFVTSASLTNVQVK